MVPRWQSCQPRSASGDDHRWSCCISIDFQAVTLRERAVRHLRRAGGGGHGVRIRRVRGPGLDSARAAGRAGRAAGRACDDQRAGAQEQLAAQFLAPAEQRLRRGRAAAVRPRGARTRRSAGAARPSRLLGVGGRCQQPVLQLRFAGRVYYVPRAGTAGQARVRMLLLPGDFGSVKSFAALVRRARPPRPCPRPVRAETLPSVTRKSSGCGGRSPPPAQPLRGVMGDSGRVGQPGPIRAKKMSVGPFLACGAARVKIAAKPRSPSAASPWYSPT